MLLPTKYPRIFVDKTEEIILKLLRAQFCFNNTFCEWAALLSCFSWGQRATSILSKYGNVSSIFQFYPILFKTLISHLPLQKEYE